MSQSVEKSVAPDADSLVWQLVEKLDEQRQFPRIPLNAPAVIVNGSGEKCRVQAMNISPDGLQLRSDVPGARLAHPQGGKIDPLNAPRVDIALSLEIDDQRRTLLLHCELLYLTTVDSDPKCVMGLRFGQLEPQSESLISAFFCDQMGMGSPATAA